ncbi:MAG TPA: hypothetical protein VGO34_05100 [Alphaproteobacteria bacterium]
MVERYGIPPTRIISAIQGFNVPFRFVQPDDRILIFTDDAMDPMVWQSAMAALRSKGSDPTLCMFSRRTHHCGDPTEAAIRAAAGADVIIALTTTALNSGTPALKAVRAEGGGGTGHTPIWLMEELTVEILTEGGGKASYEDVEEMCDIQRRIGEVYDRTKNLHVTSESGTDLMADVSGMPSGYFADRWGKMPFQRSAKTGKLGGGTWPFGEIHIEPKPGTANGTVVWDTTAHFPPGRWDKPVKLTIRDGRVTKIEGGTEADQIKRYIDTYGDEKSFEVGGEIAIGTNKHCQPRTGMMRSEKKRMGAMHFGIGTGADRAKVFSTLRLEGITDRISITADNTPVSKDGKILV